VWRGLGAGVERGEWVDGWVDGWVVRGHSVSQQAASAVLGVNLGKQASRIYNAADMALL
jgi:hypothetical protein